MKNPPPPDAGAGPDAHIETIGHAGCTLARLGLARADAVGRAEDLLPALDDADRERAGRFQSPGRRTEFVIARWLLKRLAPTGAASISHCRRWIAVAEAPGRRIGLDVESRLPRNLDAVGERLGWADLAAGQRLQAWTLWEAWRKLEGGSVLDPPDPVYAEVLTRADDLFAAPQVVGGATWFSRVLDGAVLSIAARSD